MQDGSSALFINGWSSWTFFSKWTEVKAAFYNLELENQPWQILFWTSALCMRMIWYTNRYVKCKCKCLLKRRHTDPWELSLAGFHISKASLGGNTLQKSPLIRTYDIYKMGCFIWEHCESHYSQQICTFRTDFFPAQCCRTDSTVLGYHIIFFPPYITNS